jgi:hypothetical protein
VLAEIGQGAVVGEVVVLRRAGDALAVDRWREGFADARKLDRRNDSRIPKTT